jgi:hypothetical protein
MRYAGYVAGIGDMRGIYRGLVGHLRVRKLGRPRLRYKDDIKMHFQ